MTRSGRPRDLSASLRHLISLTTTRRWIGWLSVVASVWGGLVWVTGGLDLRWGGLRFSSTVPGRPFSIAAVAGLLYALALDAGTRRAYVTRFGTLVQRFAPALATGAGVVAGVTGIVYGTGVAGGSDSSGYISQAGLWLEGTLRMPVPLSSLVPWETRPEAVFSPLGYRPATEPGFIVPTYPFGLPLVMAAFQAVAGPGAVFHVVPAMGAAAVMLTYRLGRLLGDRTTAWCRRCCCSPARSFCISSSSR